MSCDVIIAVVFKYFIKAFITLMHGLITHSYGSELNGVCTKSHIKDFIFVKLFNSQTLFPRHKIVPFLWILS